MDGAKANGQWGRMRVSGLPQVMQALNLGSARRRVPLWRQIAALLGCLALAGQLVVAVLPMPADAMASNPAPQPAMEHCHMAGMDAPVHSSPAHPCHYCPVCAAKHLLSSALPPSNIVFLVARVRHAVEDPVIEWLVRAETLFRPQQPRAPPASI